MSCLQHPRSRQNLTPLFDYCLTVRFVSIFFIIHSLINNGDSFNQHIMWNCSILRLVQYDFKPTITFWIFSTEQNVHFPLTHNVIPAAK